MYESLVLGRSLMMYRVMFFLVEHLFADLTYSRGSMKSTLQQEQSIQHVLRGSMDRLVHLGIYKGATHSEISAGTQGEYGH